MAFLGAIFSRRNINDPVATCKATRGIINVEVRSHKAGAVLPDKPVQGVTANVQGPDCPAPGVNGVTGGDGRKGFGPYHLGAYTVDLNFPPNLIDRYDLPNYPVAAQTKNLVGGIVTQYTFLLIWHWIEFQVRDQIGQPVDGLDYKLHYQAPATLPWIQIEAGKVPANGNIEKEEVKRGQYRLRLIALTNPVWSAATIVIGTAITLTADASGFDVGTAGTFEILDAFDYSKTIHTVNATVVAGVPPVLQATWTPQATELSKLNQCQVVFRAKAETAEIIGAVRKIYQNANIPVKYGDGTAIAAPVTLYFSDDSNFAGNAAAGQMAAVPLPWKERVLRITVTGAATVGVQVKSLPDGNKLVSVP
jgi:hypothetical protein